MVVLTVGASIPWAAEAAMQLPGPFGGTEVLPFQDDDLTTTN